MYAQEQRRRFMNMFANFMIWLFQAITFAYVWYKHYDSPYYRRGNFAVIGMYVIFMYILTKSFNGYKISYMRVIDLCLSHVLAILMANTAGYVFICMVWRGYMEVYPVVIVALMQSAFAIAWVNIIRHLYQKMYPPRRIVIVYGNYPLEDYLAKLSTRNDRYDVAEIVSYNEDPEKLCRILQEYQGVFLYDLPDEDRNSLVKFCYEHSIRTYVVPKITDIILKGSDDLYLVDTPLYLSRNQGLTWDERAVKRVMDIVISFTAIVISSPIMIIVSLLIWLYDRGPVVYKQTRLTRGGRQFQIYKFRSMRVDAEVEGAQLAKKQDSRVTPVGKILRNLHLDELPQLFNVLKGEMSMVGPRPERPEIFEKYEETIPEFDFRLKVKAGLTGYAQVYGKYNTTPIDKVRMDLTYIQEYSVWLDIKLMLLTFRIIFKKETSEGVDSTQVTALKDDNETENEE